MAIDFAREVVLRWDDQDPALAPLLKEGAIDVVLVREPLPVFRDACQAAGIRVAAASELKIVDLAGFRSAAPGTAALSEGLWPGIAGGHIREDEELASPTRLPWVDANGFRYAWLRALAPGRTPVLAYLPNEAAGLKPSQIVPYDTLELALVEAWISGGNYVMGVEPRYRAALIAREVKALTAWRNLGRTVRWLKQYRALFGRPALPQITLLVDEGEATAEIGNLMVRHNAAPAIESAAAPPVPDPARRFVVVAVSLGDPAPAARKRILAHAEAGSILVVDRGEGEPWWRVPGLELEHDEPDRETYRLGHGRVVAYKKVIEDPSDFALDAIDLATHARRAARTWFAPTVVVTATAGPEAGPVRGGEVVAAINYGSPLHYELMIYAQGNFSRARLFRPEGEPVDVKIAKRGTRTEINLPDLRRVGVVVLG
ncbi:MAG: hypothetical protein ACM336_12075 [Acidobacteriota bacterium]